MFNLISKSDHIPLGGTRQVYLRTDLWNDYSFITMFHLSLHDEVGNLHDIGDIKIAFKGQSTSQATYESVPSQFERLDDSYFSLGQSVDFYKRMSNVEESLKLQILDGLRDLVSQPEIINEVVDEKVFGTSLLRGVSLSVVKGQYANVLRGMAERTDFAFTFKRSASNRFGGIEIDFSVKALSSPSTNIHAIIGRNGVGKTTLLNGMINAITDTDSPGKFIGKNMWGDVTLDADYFSSLVSVSFSAFDPFEPPEDQPDPSKGTCYFYIGLKKPYEVGGHKNTQDLQKDCARYLSDCFAVADKLPRWKKAIEKLGSDENFASMDLELLLQEYNELKRGNLSANLGGSEFRELYFERIEQFLNRMSSGHAIVLLTVTYLVAKVEEKTLILLDEPESHLHPPLLSALVRAIADLLHDRNGVSIIATHSPVVIQEIPKSCVWKINRAGLTMVSSRPDIETYGENLGLLSSEVFSLEMERSGFHALLVEDVDGGLNYFQIIEKYADQLGLEGRSILKSLIAARDRSVSHD